MIGDVNLDDFFPDEKLDSTMVGKSQNQMSKLTYEKSKEYATRKYRENDSLIKRPVRRYNLSVNKFVVWIWNLLIYIIADSPCQAMASL